MQRTNLARSRLFAVVSASVYAGVKHRHAHAVCYALRLADGIGALDFLKTRPVCLYA